MLLLISCCCTEHILREVQQTASDLGAEVLANLQKPVRQHVARLRLALQRLQLVVFHQGQRPRPVVCLQIVDTTSHELLLQLQRRH